MLLRSSAESEQKLMRCLLASVVFFLELCQYCAERAFRTYVLPSHRVINDLLATASSSLDRVDEHVRMLAAEAFLDEVRYLVLQRVGRHDAECRARQRAVAMVV
jgi:hypothetical protein